MKNKRKIRIKSFKSFKEQEEDDIEYYKNLSIKQRFKIFNQLRIIAYGPPETWPSLKKNPKIIIK